MRESSLPPRLPAWTTASDDERQEMRTGARRRAESLDARLNAFVSVDAGSPRASGALEGLPYAAKDMFRRPAHEPTCGFATADDMGIVGTCDLFARLDAAGGDFVGFTNMSARLPTSRLDGMGHAVACATLGIRNSSRAALRPAQPQRWPADQWSRRSGPTRAVRCAFRPMPVA